MSAIGPNMRAFLNNIQAEPGQWTAMTLAKDFGVTPSSARRTLRALAERNLIRGVLGSPPERGGRAPMLWYPV